MARIAQKLRGRIRHQSEKRVGVGREVLVERKSPENLPRQISGLDHALEGEEGEGGWGEGGEGGGKGSTRRGEAGDLGPKNLCPEKWPDQIFPTVNFGFSRGSLWSGENPAPI